MFKKKTEENNSTRGFEVKNNTEIQDSTNTNKSTKYLRCKCLNVSIHLSNNPTPVEDPTFSKMFKCGKATMGIAGAIIVIAFFFFLIHFP